MIKKIVSGGQTGVDQAALFVATELGIDVGGWCPKGGLDEDGNCILKQYDSMREATTENPDERTRRNVEDSDGTLIIVPRSPLPKSIKDGTGLTIEYAAQIQKPYLVISLEQVDSAADIKEWIIKNSISILNIAGPRESNASGINKQTIELLRELIGELQHNYRPR